MSVYLPFCWFCRSCRPTWISCIPPRRASFKLTGALLPPLLFSYLPLSLFLLHRLTNLNAQPCRTFISNYMSCLQSKVHQLAHNDITLSLYVEISLRLPAEHDGCQDQGHEEGRPAKIKPKGPPDTPSSHVRMLIKMKEAASAMASSPICLRCCLQLIIAPHHLSCTLCKDSGSDRAAKAKTTQVLELSRIPSALRAAACIIADQRLRLHRAPRCLVSNLQCMDISICSNSRHVGILKVKIIGCRNLPVMDSASQLTDAYAEVRTLPYCLCVPSTSTCLFACLASSSRLHSIFLPFRLARLALSPAHDGADPPAQQGREDICRPQEPQPTVQHRVLPLRGISTATCSSQPCALTR